MSDVYCGAKKVPKGKRLGSMQECVESGKIMYWGVKKIDSKTLATIGAAKKSLSMDKLMIKAIGIKGKIKKDKDDIKYAKDAKKKKEAEESLKEHQEELKQVMAQYRAVDKVVKDKEKKKSKKTKKSKK